MPAVFGFEFAGRRDENPICSGSQHVLNPLAILGAACRLRLPTTQVTARDLFAAAFLVCSSCPSCQAPPGVGTSSCLTLQTFCRSAPRPGALLRGPPCGRPSGSVALLLLTRRGARRVARLPADDVSRIVTRGIAIAAHPRRDAARALISTRPVRSPVFLTGRRSLSATPATSGPRLDYADRDADICALRRRPERRLIDR